MVKAAVFMSTKRNFSALCMAVLDTSTYGFFGFSHDCTL